METTIIEAPKDGEVECRPVEYRMDRRKMYTRKKGWVTHKEFTDYLRDQGRAREIHSDGFLAISVKAAYTCGCGFEGVFKAVKCARCGRVV